MAIAAEALEAGASESAAAAGAARGATARGGRSLRKLASEAAYRMPKRSAPRQSRVGARDYNEGGSISMGQARLRDAAGGASSAARQLGGAASSGLGSLANTKPSGHIGRLIFAVAAFILALEFASYITGRYFQWNVPLGAKKLTTAAQYVGLYPGQTDKLTAAKAAAQTAATTPPSSGTLAV